MPQDRGRPPLGPNPTRWATRSFFSFVPQSIAIAPEGFRVVNGGRIFTPFSGESVVAKPGQGGGANWPPSSYDPATGYLYVCAQDRTGIFRAVRRSTRCTALAVSTLGGRFGSVTFGVTGIFAALDMRTNKLVWQQQWPERCYSGSVTTAGGLVFVGRGDGRFTALDARDGKMLWQFQTGAGVNAPASVFEHRGRQHVAVGTLCRQHVCGHPSWRQHLASSHSRATWDPRTPQARRRWSHHKRLLL